jgi:hypothetical protein
MKNEIDRRKKIAVRRNRNTAFAVRIVFKK